MTTANDQARIFNQHFHMMVNKISQQLVNLKNEDKLLVKQWIDRLKKHQIKLSDFKLRRTVINYLMMQVQTGALTAPFDKPPNFTNLEQVANVVPDLTQENVFPEDFKLPIIMENSPDHGAFLVSQPIPKCGAFCYLAVVARPANK